MNAGVRTRHVNLSKSALEFGELPLAKKPQSAHAEGEYRRNVGGRSEERRGMENRAIASKRGCKVDFLGKAGMSGFEDPAVDREWEGFVKISGFRRLEDDEDVGIVCVNVSIWMVREERREC